MAMHDAQLDVNTDVSLKALEEAERLQANRVADVRTILVVMSAAGMVFDIDSIRQKVLLAYPGAAVFFMATSGKSLGARVPSGVDLLIDFTGPRQRQPWLMARKLRRMARVAIGRNAGLFRKRIYDRIFDEKTQNLSKDLLDRERFVQKQVLALAGIALAPTGAPTPDRAKLIALELPLLSRQ